MKLAAQDLDLDRNPWQFEEEKRATTNVQNGLVFFFLFSLKKALNIRKSGGQNSEKCEKVWKVRKSVKKCRNDFAL